MSRNKRNFIIRIDDRLIHGQVIVGWVKALNLSRIIVANDKLLKDKLKKEMMKLAVPPDINVEFLSLQKAILLYKEKNWEKEESILLLESPADVCFFIDQGCRMEKINVGGLHLHDQRKQVTPNLALDAEDISCLKKLINRKIILEGRALPGDEEYSLEKVIKGKNHHG